MEQNNFLKLTVSLLSIIIFTLGGCSQDKNRSEVIVGEWRAFWETTPDESLPGLDGDNLKMNGVINFMDNGKVEISAFGYDGCIFSDDTLKNILNWKLDDTVLRFIDQGDDHGLPYTINKFTEKEMQLTLLEDINLTLSRN